jgi:hypothetical protein
MQGEATFVKVKNNAIRKDIARGIAFPEFKRKYPGAIEQEKILITTAEYKDYKGENVLEYSGFADGPSLTVRNIPQFRKSSGWILDDETACFIHSLESKPLPEEYAKLVMYVDCMVDTSVTIFTGSNDNDDFFPRYHAPGPKHKKYLEIADDPSDRPSFPYDETKQLDRDKWDSVALAFNKTYHAWDSARLIALDKRMKTDVAFAQLLHDAMDEALADTSFSESLEFYIARYISKAKALEMKRSRRVMGRCSMDSGPRDHAVGICLLAAETAKWEVFLRSHLNIMNDRFDRASDGSYAWAGRKTYLKELEELDIHSIDLLLGTCLRVRPAATEHYWGSISRVGRALADASDKNALELRLQKMITDDQLDLYNRVLMFYLYAHYIANVDDTQRQNVNKKNLTGLMEKFPDGVRKHYEPFFE